MVAGPADRARAPAARDPAAQEDPIGIRAKGSPLHRDPVVPLLATGDGSLDWAVRRDLLGERPSPAPLWEQPEVVRILNHQNGDGSWPFAGRRARKTEDYAQLATYQQLLHLVSRYRLDRRHPALCAAAEFMLAFQTPESDLRGIYGSQYTPNYTADILNLLINAGYADDRRIIRGIEWLLEMRQDDGGWAIPSRTVPGFDLGRAMARTEPLRPDRTRPSSHLVTGIVLRALGAHPRYRHGQAARRASVLLAGRFFQPDRYADRRATGYWTKLAFPFRWTDIASALDAIGRVGLQPELKDVAAGLSWLGGRQRRDGLWASGYGNSPDPLASHWVTFGVARVFKRFYGREWRPVQRTNRPASRPRP
jgi:hypothetical protein